MNPPVRLVAPATLATAAPACDALVLLVATPIASTIKSLALPPALSTVIERALALDAALSRGVRTPVLLVTEHAPGGRVVIAPLGAMTDEVDDARIVVEGATVATQRALDAGAKNPVLVLAVPNDARYARTHELAALGALSTAWIALEAREHGVSPPALQSVSVVGLDEGGAREVRAIEAGRWICRDITGTEPERMAPRRIAKLCEQVFASTGVDVSIENDVSTYPLIAAVARASQGVERHRPCVVRLEWVPEGAITRTVFLAGKGVAYDTGGADLKTHGAMAGMSRDKGGAGAVAGFVRTMAELNVPGVRVVAKLGLVRNSIGDDAFVSDEIIAARSGVRVKIGNTDAEGRLLLADLLASLKEEAGAGEHVFVSVATLTGHVYRAFGPYVGAIENGAARRAGHVAHLAAAGELWGEPLETTRPRREDYAFVAPRTVAEDVLSANRLASVDTPRGHQGPYAFLDIASGLRGSGHAFVHLDIGGVAATGADWQHGKPTGSPIAMLTAWARGG